MDRSPAEVVATLLDEEVYLCSERTMYRVLASEVPVQERRAQRTHPEYKKPELMAVVLGYHAAARAEEVELLLPLRSTAATSWAGWWRKNSALAGRLIAELPEAWRPARVLTLHSDRGAPMTSQCTAQLLADLGVTRSLSSGVGCNPFSEAFKTLKYHHLRFPDSSGIRASSHNAEHRHGGTRCYGIRPRHCRQEIRAPRSMGRSSRASSEVCRSPNHSRRPSSSILPSLPSPHRTLLSRP